MAGVSAGIIDFGAFYFQHFRDVNIKKRPASRTFHSGPWALDSLVQRLTRMVQVVGVSSV